MSFSDLLCLLNSHRFFGICGLSSFVFGSVFLWFLFFFLCPLCFVLTLVCLRFALLQSYLCVIFFVRCGF